MAPVFQVAIRLGIAAVLVYLLIVVRREAGAMTGGMWKPGLAVGALFGSSSFLSAKGCGSPAPRTWRLPSTPRRSLRHWGCDHSPSV
jgi:hypothetical protein